MTPSRCCVASSGEARAHGPGSSFAAAGSSRAERGQSKAFVARQQRLIVESERDGQDAAETIGLLDKFLLLQQLREQERAKILDEISEPS